MVRIATTITTPEYLKPAFSNGPFFPDWVTNWMILTLHVITATLLCSYFVVDQMSFYLEGCGLLKGVLTSLEGCGLIKGVFA